MASTGWWMAPLQVSPRSNPFYLDINLPLWDRHACLAGTKPSKAVVSEKKEAGRLRSHWRAAVAGAGVMTCEIQR